MLCKEIALALKRLVARDSEELPELEKAITKAANFKGSVCLYGEHSDA